MESRAQPTPYLQGKTTSVSFPNGRTLHARPLSYRRAVPSLKRLRHQFATGCPATGPSLALALLATQRALHLALGLTEILGPPTLLSLRLDLALSFLGPTFHMFARVGRSLTEITTKPALGFDHLALRLVLETALGDGHTSSRLRLAAQKQAVLSRYISASVGPAALLEVLGSNGIGPPLHFPANNHSDRTAKGREDPDVAQAAAR